MHIPRITNAVARLLIPVLEPMKSLIGWNRNPPSRPPTEPPIRPLRSFAGDRSYSPSTTPMPAPMIIQPRAQAGGRR